VDTGVLPHIRSIPPKLTKLNVVLVRTFAFSKYQHQLGLGALEAAHAAVILNRHAKVQKLVIVLAARSNEISYMTLVHADIINGIVCAEFGHQPQAVIGSA
jgi:hypothetical protein